MNPIFKAVTPKSLTVSIVMLYYILFQEVSSEICSKNYLVLSKDMEEPRGIYFSKTFWAAKGLSESCPASITGYEYSKFTYNTAP